MDLTRRRAARLIGLAPAALMGAPGAGNAQQAYPQQLIRLVCPFGAGGSPDTFCRMVAAALEPRLGARIIVENRPGANSIVGAAHVAKSPPDGYTILYATNSGTSAARALFRNLSYDPINDFAGITIVQEGYFVLLVRGADKGLSFRDFLERVRRDPAANPIGGSSSTAEVSNKMMEKAGNLSHEYVRYRTAAQMMTDLLAGRLGAAFNPVNASLPMIEQGDVAAVAVTAPERLPVLPDVVAMPELLPGVSLATWTGFFAPAQTPRPIIDLLHAKLMEVMREPAIAQWNRRAGRALFMTPAETDAFVRQDEPRWQQLMQSVGIEPA